MLAKTKDALIVFTVKTTVATACIVAVLIATAQHPSADELFRGGLAGLVTAFASMMISSFRAQPDTVVIAEEVEETDEPA